MWYAVMRDREDYDWGYGSENRRKAESMAVNMGPDAYIAVIDTEGDPVCVEEIEQSDFSIKKEYAIISHNIEDAPLNTEDTLFESQDPEEIVKKLNELEEGSEDMTEYSIEEYTVDEDGDFVEGSDFDTISNFRKRTAAVRSVKDICKMAKMTQTAMADYFSIPQRTFGNWCTGSRECPEYTKLMMQELLGLYRR
jgi:hypothetical protein